MLKTDVRGEMNLLLLPLIISLVLLIAAGAFGVWAYNSRQDYKYHTDQKITAAVDVAKQQESSAKDKEFIEKEKSPYVVYKGPQALGSINVTYPKTWSGYVSTSGNSNALLDAYFYPGVVPSIDDQGQSFALRVSVVQSAYSDTLGQLTNNGNSSQPIKTQPYQLPSVPGTVGVKLTGAIQTDKTGVMVVLPLRNNTLEIWTEGSQFVGDFNNIILPKFTFSP